MSLQTVRDAVFRSRLLLAPPCAYAVPHTMGWPSLASSSELFVANKDALYAFEALRPSAGFAIDWKALTNPLLYANVLLEFTAQLAHTAADTSALCTWFVPLIAAGRRDIESLFEIKLQVALITLDEEKLMAAYNVACSLMQMVVVLSNRVMEGDAMLKLCIKLLMVAEDALMHLHAARQREPPTAGQVVISTNNSHQRPVGLDQTIPLTAASLAILLAWVRAQLAEFWLGTYTTNWEQTRSLAALDKVIGAAFLAHGYYTEVYERIHEMVGRGSNDETRADLMEAFSAGPAPLGKMRRVAAVKRHYALALAASYVAEQGPDHHRPVAHAILKSGLVEARKSLNKRTNVLSPQQEAEFQADITALQAILDEMVEPLDANGDDFQANDGLTLQDLFAKLPRLPRHNADAPAITEPTELLTAVMTQVNALVKGALAENVRVSLGEFDMDRRIDDLLNGLLATPAAPAPTQNSANRAPPPGILSLFQHSGKALTILKRLGVLTSRATELNAHYRKQNRKLMSPQEQRSQQLLTEQLTALVTLVARVLIPDGLDVMPTELLALATRIANGDWVAVVEHHRTVIPSFSTDAQVNPYADIVERAQTLIRDDTAALMEHFHVETRPLGVVVQQ